jgi:translation elongation factor EF-Tu-like GTPase
MLGLMDAYRFIDVLEPAGKEPIRVLARISVIPTEQGGRKGPFTTNFRPNHNFGGCDDRIFYIGTVDVLDETWVYPGETRELPVTFLNVRGIAELLKAGRKWRIQEGGRLIADAEVLALL